MTKFKTFLTSTIVLSAAMVVSKFFPAFGVAAAISVTAACVYLTIKEF